VGVQGIPSCIHQLGPDQGNTKHSPDIRWPFTKAFAEFNKLSAASNTNNLLTRDGLSIKWNFVYDDLIREFFHQVSNHGKIGLATNRGGANDGWVDYMVTLLKTSNPKPEPSEIKHRTEMLTLLLERFQRVVLHLQRNALPSDLQEHQVRALFMS
jgi:hypothetical protein